MHFDVLGVRVYHTDDIKCYGVDTKWHAGSVLESVNLIRICVQHSKLSRWGAHIPLHLKEAEISMLDLCVLIATSGFINYRSFT